MFFSVLAHLTNPQRFFSGTVWGGGPEVELAKWLWLSYSSQKNWPLKNIRRLRSLYSSQTFTNIFTCSAILLQFLMISVNRIVRRWNGGMHVFILSMQVIFECDLSLDSMFNSAAKGNSGALTSHSEWSESRRRKQVEKEWSCSGNKVVPRRSTDAVSQNHVYWRCCWQFREG